MVGKGRHSVLAVQCADPVLSVVAPIGLGAAVGTALIIDADAPAANGRRTLRDVLAEGPMSSELSPGRPGLAHIATGHVDPDDLVDLIHQIAAHWPAVVVRAAGARLPLATVPVVPLYPGLLAPAPTSTTSVWQRFEPGQTAPGPGPLLPCLRSGALRRLISGVLPRRSRWIAAWAQVWEIPWA